MSSLAPPRGQVDRSSPLRSLNPVWTAALLLAAALVAWIVTIDRMWGMDAGPGTDLGGLGWFAGIWVTMMAAMMLPSVAPMALLFARISRERRGRGRAFVPTWVFLAGYLAAWTVYGLAAYGLFRLVTAFGAGWLAWDRAGPYVAGGAIAAAGLYQLTPLKEVCLRHCRGPTPLLGLPGTKATAEGLTMQLSLRTTLRSPPSWCSITTVRSRTARTRTCLPSTIALKPPLTSWLRGGTMLASETSSTGAALLMRFVPWAKRRSAAEAEVGY